MPAAAEKEFAVNAFLTIDPGKSFLPVIFRKMQKKHITDQ